MKTVHKIQICIATVLVLSLITVIAYGINKQPKDTLTYNGEDFKAWEYKASDSCYYLIVRSRHYEGIAITRMNK